MDYDSYFNQLIEKNTARKKEFPSEKILRHQIGRYFANAFTYKDFKYNFEISSNRSRTFGKEFVGLIVELYIDGEYYESYFNQLKEHKDRIEEDLNLENIVWQSPEDTPSGNVARIYAKKSIDLEDTSKWNDYTEWQINTMIKFLKVLPEYTKNLKNIASDKNESSKLSRKADNRGVRMNIIKNIILYGAPGVGKTHNYKNLISMIEEGKNQKEIFDTIAENRHVEIENETYESIKKEKRVEFVTFHQSYSYEDFIEGFRPNESGNIELEDGIFKRFSLNALNKIKESVFQHISFDEAYDILRTSYINEELETLKTVTNVEIVINDFKEKSLSVQTVNAKDSQYVKKHDLETVVNAMLKNLVSKPSDIRQLEVKKDTFSLSGYYFSIGNKIVEIIKNHKIDVEKEQNFYIVIDEINRGNISKIFGELITLIEEDKRDIYEVTLPYSKEKFKVPSNLYIIATMNSTDKSIATIDIALRRRFTFLKMKPNEELITFPHAKELFKKLNKFIEENLNEDYKLGHSYFMNIQNSEDLEFVKEYKIKSLLEEYFYVDKNKLEESLNILKIEIAK